MNDRVFVYGTLRRGEVHEQLLRGAQYLGGHRTEPRFTLFNLGRFPAAVAGGSTALVGEVFAVDAATLRWLDQFEHCPQTFLRTQIATPLGEAWIYLYRLAPGTAMTIPSGDWLNR